MAELGEVGGREGIPEGQSKVVIGFAIIKGKRNSPMWAAVTAVRQNYRQHGLTHVRKLCIRRVVQRS